MGISNHLFIFQYQGILIIEDERRNVKTSMECQKKSYLLLIRIAYSEFLVPLLFLVVSSSLKITLMPTPNILPRHTVIPVTLFWQ